MNNTEEYLNRIITTPSINHTIPVDSIDQVEIVVPIFNAFDAVKKCIEALIQHNPQSNRITLLDDASTDKHLIAYLHNISEHYPHINLIKRKRNLGYLHNINKHLKDNKHTVLLLNSDTQVTSGWLDSMLEVASDQQVGVVCPLSNHATILSLPNTETQCIAQLKKLHGLWFPIPTAVGFCMLIKPGLWQRLNGFDPYYTPGYGEECDFSMLVRQQDLQIACAPAAYVFHQGSQSFKQQANKLQQQHQNLLDLRWPSYSEDVLGFIKLNPVQWIKQWLQKNKISQPRLLHVVHGINNKGGVEMFTKSLITSFDDKFQHTLLVKSSNKPSTTESSIEIIEIDMDAFKPEHKIFNLPADLYNHKTDLYFKHLLEWGGFQHVHFHSLVGIGTAVWPQICHQLEIPYAMFFHDHNGLCQIFSLSNTVNQQEIYCGKLSAEIQNQQCHQCIQEKTQKTKLTTQSYISLREQIWKDNIKHAHKLYFCSDYLLQAYSQKHLNIKHKSLVLVPSFLDTQLTPTKPISSHKVKLAFLGQFGALKGAQMFIDLYHHISDQNINWEIIGGIDPTYQNQLDQTSIFTRGVYQSVDLPQLLSSVDIIVFTTQIPETYGITLTEAMINGIPVVAPDIGVYKSRIKTKVNGLLFESNDINSLANTVTQMIKLQRSEQRIKQIEYTAPSADATTILSQIYESSITNKNTQPIPVHTKQHLLASPKINAYQLMQKWLDAPMTLEAANDWLAPPHHLNVIILGQNETEVHQTKNSLHLHLHLPIIHNPITAHALKKVIDTDFVLLINAGSLVNENIGNWLHQFQQDDEIASLADYALHNKQLQIYAPQFMGRFSWQNLLLNQLNMGCLLLKPQLIKNLINQSFWSTQLNLQKVMLFLYHEYPNQLMHFPYLCYTMADHQYAAHWKLQQQIQLTKHKSTPNEVCVLIETQLTGQALNALKRQYQQQVWDNSIKAQLNFINHKEKTLFIQSMDCSDAAVFVIADNIRFSHDHCLAQMLSALYKSHVDTLTIPAARDVTKQYLIAKKTGAANHFQGIGRIKDLRFYSPNAVHEHEWLDDDCWLFTAQAWHNVVETYQNDESLFTALRISKTLHQNGYSIGVLAINDLYKKGLPSLKKPIILPNLNKQRKQMIEENGHLPLQSHYPKALSCRQDNELDLMMTTFKTPKRLTRIVAYAQDDWASGFYRVKSPLNTLAANNKISVHFLYNRSQKAIPTPYELYRMEADILFLHGFYSDQQLAALNQYKKQLNIRIIISIDDLLTEIPEYNPFSKNIPDDIETRIKLACSLADTFIVSTSQLAQRFNHYHSNIAVIPNRLSQHIWPNQPNVIPPKKRLRVGWAGAGQHQADLNWLKQVVKQTHSFCDWVFFGDQPTGLSKYELEFHQPVNFLEYPEKLQSLNLNLGVAPLIDNPFNRSKSSLKLLEYGVLGLPVMASDLSCYHQSPAMLLPNDFKTWVKQLQTLNSNRKLLRQNGQAMMNWVHQNYWLEEHQNQWLEILGIN